MRRMAMLGSLVVLGCSSGGSASPDARPAEPDAFIASSPPDVGPPPPHDAAIGDLGGDHWDGTIDRVTFPSGSSRVRVWLDHGTGDGPRTGVVTFGDGPAFPLPVRGDVGYPPGFDFRTHAGDETYDQPIEAFGYPILAGSQSGAHLRVVVDARGLWEPWCELQTPVPLGSGDPGWGCLPIGGGQESADGCIYEPAEGPWYAIDCLRMSLCMSSYCDCTESGCTARPGFAITFELDVSGTSADGTLTMWGVHAVHLAR